MYCPVSYVWGVSVGLQERTYQGAIMKALKRVVRALSDRWLPITSRFMADDDGPTATEYAVLLALIVMVSFATIASIGQHQLGIWQIIADATAPAIPV